MRNLRLVQKETPKSPVAERAVLAAMLMHGDGAPMTWSMSDLVEILCPEDFSDEQHGALFEWLMLRHEAGLAYDFISTCEALMTSPDPSKYGGASKVNWIYGSEHSTVQTLHYAEIISETAKKRRMLRLLADTHNQLAEGTSLSEVRTRLEAGVASRDLVIGRSVESIADLIGPAFNQIEAEAQGRATSYYSTGIPELDNNFDVNGVSVKGVTLVIARSGIGKTTLANTMAVQMARNGRRVLLCPTETSKQRRVTDLTYALAGVNQQTWGKICKYRSEAHGSEMPYEDEINDMRHSLSSAAHMLANLPIAITETGWTVERLCSEIRRQHRDGQVDVVFIDYLQDLLPSRVVKGQRHDQVTHASKTIKDLQCELGIPFVVFAQAKHTDEVPKQRSSNAWLVPQMGDVQHSSQAYQDAEEVWCLYRQDYYADRYADDNGQCPYELPGLAGHLTIAFRKRRDGNVCTVNIPAHMATKWIGRR